MGKTITLAAVISGLILLSSGLAKAQSPDFSICDGLTGSAWGLCRGGVAAGCADDTGNQVACLNIEETFLAVTGNEAPWLSGPPAVCPCDFSKYPKTIDVWDPGEIQFQCPETFAVFRDNVDTEIGATRAGLSADNPFCQLFDNGEDALPQFEMNFVTLEQFEACRLDIISYGKAFLTLNAGVPVDDTCTP